MEKEIVIFRKERNGDIFAVFPYDICDPQLNMTCFAHVGQHSAMNPDYFRETKPATPDEYEPLQKELESRGYNLEIKQRVNWERYRLAALELQKKL